MPLWTILTKWPAPTGPTWAYPPSGARVQEGRLDHAPPPPWCRRPSGSSPPSGPTPRPRCRRRRSRCPWSPALGRGGGLVVVGVAAVDDDVAPFEALGRERGDGRRRSAFPDGHHDPGRPGRAQLGRQLLQRGRRLGPLGRHRLPGRRPTGRRPPPGARRPAGARSCWRPSCPGRPSRSSSSRARRCVSLALGRSRLERQFGLVGRGPCTAARRTTWRRSARPRPRGSAATSAMSMPASASCARARPARRRGRRRPCGPPCRGRGRPRASASGMVLTVSGPIRLST